MQHTGSLHQETISNKDSKRWQITNHYISSQFSYETPIFFNTKVPLLIDMFGFRREDRLQSSLATDGTDLISTHFGWKMLHDLKGSKNFPFVQAANSDQPGNVQSNMLLRGNSGHLSTAATLMHEWTVSLLDVPSSIASFVYQELCSDSKFWLRIMKTVPEVGLNCIM